MTIWEALTLRGKIRDKRSALRAAKEGELVTVATRVRIDGAEYDVVLKKR